MCDLLSRSAHAPHQCREAEPEIHGGEAQNPRDKLLFLGGAEGQQVAPLLQAVVARCQPALGGL